MKTGEDGTPVEVIQVVGAAILGRSTAVDGGCRVLAAQRGATMSHALQWEFPGGKVEAGESFERALVREVREELAIDIEVGAELGTSEWVLGDPKHLRRLVLRVFLCRWSGGEIRLAEHRAWRWVDASQIASLSWSQADRPLLERLLPHLTGAKPTSRR